MLTHQTLKCNMAAWRALGGRLDFDAAVDYKTRLN